MAAILSFDFTFDFTFDFSPPSTSTFDFNFSPPSTSTSNSDNRGGKLPPHFSLNHDTSQIAQ
jgi:hypothetical protein